MPRLKGSLSTIAPARSASSAVWSAEPSSTTTIWNAGSAARTSATTAATDASSLCAGMITIRRTPTNRSSRAVGRVTTSSSFAIVPERTRHRLAFRPMSDPLRAVVLAGGLGLRLRPYTTILPKPLVPVGDRPILEHIIRRLHTSGVGVVDLCIGHLGELIQVYF